MNVTFTERDLANFAAKLTTWADSQYKWVLTQLMENFDVWAIRHTSGNFQERLHRLFEEFEKKNPRPSWKDSL